MKTFHYPAYGGDANCLVVQIPPAEIGYVNSLTEGYEGVALFRTRDGDTGLAEFLFVEEFRADFESFLFALEREIPIRRLAVK